MLHALLLSAVTGLAAPPGTPAPSLLVLPLEAKAGVDKDVAELLTGALSSELQKRERFTVVTFADLQTVAAQEQLRQLADCNSVSCMAEVAGALNAEELITGSLGKLGDTFLLNVSRIHTRSGTVKARLSQTFDRIDRDTIVSVIPRIADLLLIDAAPVRDAGPRAVEPAPVEKPLWPLLASAAGAGAAGLALAAGILLLAVSGGALLADRASSSDGHTHVLGQTQWVASFGGLGGGALLGMAGLLGLVAGAGALIGLLALRFL